MKALDLRADQVFFFSYHVKADEEHAGRKVWGPIVDHARESRDREEILKGANSALEGLRLFYKGVADLGDRFDEAYAKKSNLDDRVVRL